MSCGYGLVVCGPQLSGFLDRLERLLKSLEIKRCSCDSLPVLIGDLSQAFWLPLMCLFILLIIENNWKELPFWSVFQAPCMRFLAQIPQMPGQPPSMREP